MTPAWASNGRVLPPCWSSRALKTCTGSMMLLSRPTASDCASASACWKREVSLSILIRRPRSLKNEGARRVAPTGYPTAHQGTSRAIQGFPMLAAQPEPHRIREQRSPTTDAQTTAKMSVLTDNLSDLKSSHGNNIVAPSLLLRRGHMAPEVPRAKRPGTLPRFWGSRSLSHLSMY
ncbi:hypothetical protein D3C72_1524400 [compost metagenome]